MTVEFFTGFAGCGTTAECYQLLDTAGVFSYSATGGWENGKSITGSGNTSWVASKTVPAGKTKVFGMYIRGASLYSTVDAYPNSKALGHFVGPGIRIYNYSDGLRIYRGTTQIGTTVAGVNVPTTPTHLEVKCFSDASAGTVEIKIDGVSVSAQTGLNTGGEDITAISWGCTYASTARLTNLFAATDWAGALKSALLKPSSDDSVQFTPNSGADNFSRINQSASDADTTYVASSTVGHKDTYGYEDLASGLVPVAAMLVTMARKDDAGARSLKSIAVQDATEYDMVSGVLTDTYPSVAGAGLVKHLAAAPDATSWTREKLNAIKWGFEVTA